MTPVKLWTHLFFLAQFAFNPFRDCRSNFNSVHCHTSTRPFPVPSWRPGACVHCKKLKVRRDPVHNSVHPTRRSTSPFLKKSLIDCSWLTWILFYPFRHGPLLPGLFRPVPFYTNYTPNVHVNCAFPNTDPIRTSMLRIPNTLGNLPVLTDEMWFPEGRRYMQTVQKWWTCLHSRRP